MKTTERTFKNVPSGKAIANAFRYSSDTSLQTKLFRIQTKLTIGQPNDTYEQEADRVADRVMTMPEPAHIQRSCSNCRNEEVRTKPLLHTITPLVQRQPVPEEDEQPVQSKPDIQKQEDEEEEPIQTKPDIQRQEEEPVQAKMNNTDTQTPNLSTESSINQSRGQGSPLHGETLSFMENRFGADFGHVRIHNDNNAVQLNRQLHAHAFTKGSDIYFGSAKYNPESSQGKHLLAHELTHVIQQQVKSRNITSTPNINNTYIQRLTLKGFPYARAHQMLTAIARARRVVNSCSRLSKVVKWLVSKKLYSLTYKYDRDMDSCGWTFPFSWFVKISENAFNTRRCCDLESTLAHEAAHTVFHTEKWARDLECSCFGCCSE